MMKNIVLHTFRRSLNPKEDKYKETHMWIHNSHTFNKENIWNATREK